MLKVLALFLLISSQAQAATCTLSQTESWFRNDNGTQTSATYIGSQNSNITQTITSSNVRLRILTGCTGGLCGATAGTQSIFNWKVSRNSGAYAAVSGNTYVIPHTSTNVTNGTATTSQLTGGTGQFAAGVISTNGSATDQIWAGSCSGTCISNTENELVLQFTASAVNLDTYDFEAVSDGTDGCVIGSYSQIPRATISIASYSHGYLNLLGSLGDDIFNAITYYLREPQIRVTWSSAPRARSILYAR